MSVTIKTAGLVVHKLCKLDGDALMALLSLAGFKKRLSKQCQGQIALAFALLLSTAAHQAAAGQDWIVKSDTEFAEYNQKKATAEQFVRDVRREVEAALPVLRGYWGNGISPAVPAQGKKFSGLAQRGEELSEPFRPFASCRALGTYAQQLWLSQIGTQLKADVLYNAWHMYGEALRDCQMSIDIPPEETITVTGPSARARELPDSCRVIQDGAWTCPASLRAKLEGSGKK